MKAGFYIGLACLAMFLGFALVLFGNAWYTRTQVQHECQALRLLIAAPAPKPADPKGNPSRQFAYEFHQALTMWSREDGC